jgi:hypothetical protein
MVARQQYDLTPNSPADYDVAAKAALGGLSRGVSRIDRTTPPRGSTIA